MSTGPVSSEFPALQQLAKEVSEAMSTIKAAMQKLSKSGVTSDALIEIKPLPTHQILRSLETLQTQIAGNDVSSEVDPLGLRDRKVVVQAIDLLMYFEIAPRFDPGIGVAVSQRISNGTADVLKEMQQAGTVWPPTESMGLEEWLERLVRIIDQCMGLTDVGAILANRYLADLLAGLMQCAYKPVRPGTIVDGERRVELKKMFSRLFDKSEPYLLIESLTVLLNAAAQSKQAQIKWFCIMCGRFLSRVLLRTGGVQVTLDYMVSDGELTTEKMHKISNLLLTPPKGMDTKVYLEKVVPQVMQLADPQTADMSEVENDAHETIRMALDAKARQSRVSSTAAYALGQCAEKHPDAFRALVVPHVCLPLLQWFEATSDLPTNSETQPEHADDDLVQRALGQGTGKRPLIQEISNDQDDQVVSSPLELETSLAWLHLFTQKMPSERLLAELVCPVFLPLFYMFAQDTQNTRAKTTLVSTLTQLPQPAATALILRLIQSVRSHDCCWPVFAKAPTTGKVLLVRNGSRQDHLPIEALIDVLMASDLKQFLGDLFITLLREQEAMLEILRSGMPTEDLTVKWWLVSQTTLEMVEKFGPAVLAQRAQVLAFVHSTLARACDSIRENRQQPSTAGEQQQASIEELVKSLSVGGKSPEQSLDDVSEEVEGRVGETETVILALMLLGQILLGDDSQWDNPSLKLLRRIQSQLTLLSSSQSLPVVARLAGEVKLQVAMVVAISGHSATEPHHDSETGSEVLRFNSALRDINDAMIPIQAHGIVELRNMVLAKSPALADATRLSTAVDIFVEMLRNDDSFIYFNAIKGLAALADIHAERFIPRLAGMYRRGTVDERLRVGEALLQTVLRAGEMLAEYSKILLPPLLESVREDGVIAQSAISILAAIAQTYPLALLSSLHEIIHCLGDILALGSVEVRRAAVVFLVELVRGQSVDADTLRTAYRLLRRIEQGDEDDIVRHNASVAVEDVAEGMRERMLSIPQLL